jgi:hypothetical protein
MRINGNDQNSSVDEKLRSDSYNCSETEDLLPTSNLPAYTGNTLENVEVQKGARRQEVCYVEAETSIAGVDNNMGPISSNSEGGNCSEGQASNNTSYGVETHSILTEGNVVTNTTNSSSGDDRSASKSGSSSSIQLTNKFQLERGEATTRNDEGTHQSCPSHPHTSVPFHRPSADNYRDQLNFSSTAQKRPENISHYSSSGMLRAFSSSKHKTTKEENHHKHPRSIEHIIKKRHKSDKSSEAVGHSSDTSDSGYEASSSSNNLSGTSSPSSSEASQRPSNRKMIKRKEKISQQGFRRESYCSSDLADFSSGVSSGSSPIISPGPLSEDTEDVPAKTNDINTPRYEEKPKLHASTADVGSKPRGLSAPSTSPSFQAPHHHRHNRSKRSLLHIGSLNTNDMKQITCNTHFSDRHIAIDSVQKRSNTWSFVEKHLKRKMNVEDFLKKKTYEEHCKELNANYESAIKRIRHIDSRSTACSSISTGDTDITAQECVSTNTQECVSTNTQECVSTNTPIYDIGVDAMANVLTYLKPREVYSFLIMPLSKTFKCTFSDPQDLWKVLCLSEPFYANVDNSSDASDESICSYPVCKSIEMKHLLGRYRLLYSSFIKCVRYLDRIMDDAKHGRTPAGSYDGEDTPRSCSGDSNSLENFFAQAPNFKNGTGLATEGNTSIDQNITLPKTKNSTKSATPKVSFKSHRAL